MIRKSWFWFALICYLLMSFSLFGQFAGGSGTEADPWLIATPGQLNSVRTYLGGEHANKHYRLISDIDIGLDNWGYWTPIGATTPFYGTIDGDSHTISNMTINYMPNGNMGFVGIATNATIKDLNLINISIRMFQGNLLEGGGLVGQCHGSMIHNCHVSGTYLISVSGDPLELQVNYLGGLIGWSNSTTTVTNCSSSCEVGAVAQPHNHFGSSWVQIQNVGGLIGLNQGTVINSSANGYCGAVISNMQFGLPTFSTATGGLIGNNSGEVTNCHSGSVVQGNEVVGGLIGINTGQIDKCYFTGSVQGFSSMGGLAGSNSGTISNSYSLGGLLFYEDIVYTDYWGPYVIGGFLGTNTGTVTNCFSTGGINWSWVEPQSYSGFVSENYGAISNSYWDIAASAADSSAAGYGRMTQDMTYPYSDSTYVGWDFADVWLADSQGLINDGYPFLKWQYEEPMAEFSASTNEGFAPLSVQFTDCSLQGTGGELQWLWDFGDGATSNEQNPEHLYLLPGMFTVSLTVVNAYATSSINIKTDYIEVILPVSEILLTSSSSLDFGSVFVEESSDYTSVTISSVGGEDVNISSIHFFDEPQHFVLQDTLSTMVIAHGQTATIHVRFNPHSIGNIRDTLYIVSDAINHPLLKITLSGTGLYVLPQAPIISDISVDGNDVHIGWEAVTLNMHGQPITPDYYFIYISSNPDMGYTFMGLTQYLEYTHPFIGLGAQKVFYRVTAVKFYRDDLTKIELDNYIKTSFRKGMKKEEVEEVMGRNERSALIPESR